MAERKMVLLFFLLFAGIIRRTYCSAPVLMWGSEKPLDYSTTSLKKFSNEDFTQLMNEILADKLRNVAVFVQRTLSVEDLGRRDSADRSAYPKLEEAMLNEDSSKYFPSVEDAVYAFKSFKSRNFSISNFDDSIVLNNPKNLFIVKLDEPSIVFDKFASSRQYDDIIHKTCNKIKTMYNDVVCILTGTDSSWVEPNLISFSRRLLQATDTLSQYPLNFFKAKNSVLFYTNQPPVLQDLKTNIFYNVSFIDQDQATGSVVKQTFTVTTAANIISLNDSKSTTRIEFKFVFTTSESFTTWHFDNISCAIPYTNKTTVTLNTTSDISGSYNFSYHTPSTVIFKNPDYKLTFSSLQIELFNGYDRNSFSPAEDTVGFFTIPIWSGLFVTSILVTIVLVGLSLIFDIKTMDQFDDPKGKTVTINASE